MPRPNPADSKLFQGAVAKLRKDDRYGALQGFETTYNRAFKKGAFEEAYDIARVALGELLAARDVQGAKQMGESMVAALERVSAEAALALVPEVCSCLISFREVPGGSEAAQTLGRSALKWSASASDHKRGLPALHDAMGLLAAGQGAHDQAVAHYTLGSSASTDALASSLNLWMAEAPPAESEFFVARAVLSLLATGSVVPACVLVERFGALDAPLVHMAQFLCDAVARSEAPLFDDVVAAYAPALDAEPSLREYLALIENIAFGRPMPSRGGLSDLISSIMGGFGAAS
eukprot:c12945_g1_i1.p1 GENE.c12945_g1_i1~~c12945_g1_i1.p1  ORF type:complete len:290 (+),score=55.03 c12945_g1_i1:63-932(+)